MFTADLLKGRVVFITGGGTGLGKSMALRFGELGARVVIASRRQEVLEKTAAAITNATGAEVLPLELDVRDVARFQECLEAAVSRFGEVNVLVNNAAGNFISPTEALSPKAFDVIIDIVLKGSVYGSLLFGKYWIKTGIRGRILNIVTTYAETGSGFVVPSAVAKAGVRILTRSLAAEWGRYGITTVAIAPGPIPTRGAWERLMPPGFEEQLLARQPLGRTGTREELANLAAFLIAPQTEYINGEIVTMDGGEWLLGAGEFNAMRRLTPEQWAEMARRGRRSKDKAE